VPWCSSNRKGRDASRKPRTTGFTTYHCSAWSHGRTLLGELATLGFVGPLASPLLVFTTSCSPSILLSLFLPSVRPSLLPCSILPFLLLSFLHTSTLLPPTPPSCFILSILLSFSIPPSLLPCSILPFFLLSFCPSLHAASFCPSYSPSEHHPPFTPSLLPPYLHPPSLYPSLTPSVHPSNPAILLSSSTPSLIILPRQEILDPAPHTPSSSGTCRRTATRFPRTPPADKASI